MVEICRKLLAFDANFSADQLLLDFALYQTGDFEGRKGWSQRRGGDRSEHPDIYYLSEMVQLLRWRRWEDR